MAGEIKPPETLMLRIHVGEAEGPDGSEYELSYSHAGTPIVMSKASGQWFVLPWSDIIDLAREAGIDEEP